MPSDLPLDCRKILSRWSAQEYYIYLRPITSKFLDRSKKHTIYWKGQVQYRTTPPGLWSAEGFSLAEVIRELDAVVPKLRRNYTATLKDGWLAPTRKSKGRNSKRKRKA